MKFLITIFSFLFVSVAAQAQTASFFAYEGVLTDAGGTPITSSQNVTFQILYGGTCVTFEETHSITPGTNGEFSVIVGTGVRQDSTGNTAARIMGSSGMIACTDTTTRTMSGFTVRQLHIKVGSTDLSPDVTIGNVPFAWNSQRLGDKAATDFVQINSTQGVTQANLESIFARFASLDAMLNGDFSTTPTTGITNLTNTSIAASAAIDRSKLANGTANHVLINGSGGVMSSEAQLAISRGGTGTGTAPAAGQLLIGNGSGYTLANLTAGSNVTITNSAGGVTIAASSNTGTVTSITAGTGLTGGTITTSGTIGLGTELSGLSGLSSTGLVQRTGTGTYSTLSSPTSTELGYLSGATSSLQTQIGNKLAKAGDTMTGSLQMSAQNSIKFYDSANSGYVGMRAPSSVGTSFTLTLPNTDGTSGQFLTTNGSGLLSWASQPTSIDRSKLAAGTPSHVLINDAAGALSSEANLSVARGGTGAGTFTANGIIMSGATGTSALSAITCAGAGRSLEWTGTTWACSADYMTSGSPGSKVNYVVLTGAAAGSAASISAGGSDTSINLQLSGKGTGYVVVSSALYTTSETTSKTYRTISSVNNTGTTINFSNGNLQYTSSSCQAMTLSGLADGATYVLAVKGTALGTCSFTASGFTIKMPPDHGTTESGKSTLYTFMVMGTDVYVSWVPGY